MEDARATPLLLDLEKDSAREVSTSALLSNIRGVTRRMAQEEYDRGLGSRPGQRSYLSLPEGSERRRRAKKLESAYRSRFHLRLYPEMVRTHVEAVQRRQAMLESWQEHLLEERDRLSLEVVRAENRNLKQELGRLKVDEGGQSSGRLRKGAGNDIEGPPVPSLQPRGDPRSRRRQIISEFASRCDENNDDDKRLAKLRSDCTLVTEDEESDGGNWEGSEGNVSESDAASSEGEAEDELVVDEVMEEGELSVESAQYRAGTDLAEEADSLIANVPAKIDAATDSDAVADVAGSASASDLNTAACNAQTLKRPPSLPRKYWPVDVPSCLLCVVAFLTAVFAAAIASR